MRQLDLFGNVIETPVADKKEPVAEVAVAEVDETTGAKAEDKGEMRVMLSLEDFAEEDTEVIEDLDVEEESVQSVVAEEEEKIVMQQEDLPEAVSDEVIEEVVADEAPAAVEEEVVINKQAKAAVPKVKAEKPKLPQKRGRKSFKEMDAEVDLIEVPEDEVLFKKQYYPISEVAGWFKVNTSLLRFWENEFEVLKPRKNRKGDRLFRPEDVKNLQLIYHLLRERKYTIEGAKDYLKSHHRRASLEMQLTTTLQKFKSFLLDLKANLQE